jgi:hypothetical protein
MLPGDGMVFRDAQHADPDAEVELLRAQLRAEPAQTAGEALVLLEEGGDVVLLPAEIDLDETQPELVEVVGARGARGGEDVGLADAEPVGIPAAPVGERADGIGEAVAGLQPAAVRVEQRERVGAGLEDEVAEGERGARLEHVVAPVKLDGELAEGRDAAAGRGGPGGGLGHRAVHVVHAAGLAPGGGEHAPADLRQPAVHGLKAEEDGGARRRAIEGDEVVADEGAGGAVEGLEPVAAGEHLARRAHAAGVGVLFQDAHVRRRGAEAQLPRGEQRHVVDRDGARAAVVEHAGDAQAVFPLRCEGLHQLHRGAAPAGGGFFRRGGAERVFASVQLQRRGTGTEGERTGGEGNFASGVRDFHGVGGGRASPAGGRRRRTGARRGKKDGGSGLTRFRGGPRDRRWRGSRWRPR